MTRRVAIAAGLVALGLLALFFAPRSPPAWLSFADALAGGGRGAERVASAVAFGTHGQTLDVWAPARKPEGRRPVIVWFYGGGWVKGDRAAYAFAARAFARAGYVVVVPDYRKVPAVRFPAFVEDGAEAVAWTRANIARWGGDPRRLALAGHSAGAHTAVLLALDPRWLRGAGAPPGSVQAAIGLSGPYDFYPFDKKRSIDAMAAWPTPRDTQPIAFARADAPPLLLVTSSRDDTVRPKNAINLAARMHAVGGRVVLKNYPGLGHEDVVMALSVPFRSKAPVLTDTLAFLRAHDLGPGGRTAQE